MEENRYKRLTQLFINRVDTLEMMNVFDGKEKKGLKVYRHDSEDYYHYFFIEPLTRKNDMFGLSFISRENDRSKSNIAYELCLNKHKNLAVIICYIEPFAAHKSIEYILRYTMSTFKKFGFKRYSYDQDLKYGKVKVKAVIENDMDISNVFEILDIFSNISNIAYQERYFSYHASYEEFKEIIEKNKDE